MRKALTILAGLLVAASAFGQADYQRNVWIGGNGTADGLSVAAGDVPGTTRINKFGAAPDFDTADGEVTIWDAAEDGVAWENMTNDYSATADIDSISSSSASDSVVIEVQGLGATTNQVTQNVTLNGTNRVALGTALLRVFRAKNMGSTTLVGHVIVYPNTTLAAGVPSDNDKIRLVVQPENNQTEMAFYTIPAGKTGYMRSFYAATAGASRDSNYVIKIIARPAGGVFQLKHRQAISDDGTSSYQHWYDDPPSYAAGTDIEMRAEMTLGSATAASISGGFDLVLVDD